MRRALFATIGILGCLFIVSIARSQSEIPTRITLQNRTGELPFSTSIGTSVEHVDASTGALIVRIPIVSVPGRGIDSGLSLVFNSNYFLLAPRADSVGNPYWVWTIPIQGGWQTNQPYTSHASQSIHCDNNGGFDNISSSYIYYDEDGTPHPRAVQNHSGGGTCSGITDSPNPDMSGDGAVGTTTTMTTADGTVIATSGNWTDSNGNKKAWSSTGSYTGTKINTTLDTLGRTFFTSQFTLNAQNQPLQTTYTVHDSSGTSQNYVVNWQKTNIQTAFHDTLFYGPEHELATFWFVISSIQLPNGTSYTFKYDEGGYGGITEIDLPDGGVITYTYANLQNTFKTRHYVTSRTQTVNGVSSTWSFSIVPAAPIEQSADGYISTVTYPAMGTPPASDQSVFSSGNGAIVDAKIYSGTATGTPLREYVITYTADADPYAADACYNLASNLPPLPIQPVGLRVVSVKTILENNQQSLKTYAYESPLLSYVYHPNHCSFVSPGNDSKVPHTYTTSRGNVTDIYEYDWGAGAPSPTPIRHTVNVYAKNSDSNYTSRNIVDKITQQTIYDANGIQIAQTQYEYDTTALTSTSSTAAQHDDTNFPSSFIYRGNVSRVKRWRNTDGTLLSTVYTYDDLGNIRAIADPLTNTTSYSYADSFANSFCPPTAGKTGQAFVSQVTKAITTQHIQVVTFPCTGLVQAHKDQNDINASRAGITYTYDLFGRAAQKNMPDGGQISTVYTDIPPVSATTTTKITSAVSTISTSLMDGLGRLIQTQLSDPGGADFVDTTYDPVGHISTKSNPHRTASSPTDGNTTYLYDALGRTCVVIPPDGAMPSGSVCPTTAPANDVFTSYAGNTTTVTDQAGQTRKSQTDVLGHLTSVWEDPATLNYLTSYGYNSFGNLSSVLQNGSRSRSFTYNSLSQLLTAINPESGTITYSYDDTGKVLTKVAPAPNQTGTGTVTTTYGYDALNRPTQKTFSDTTPTIKYGYDAVAPAGCTMPTLTINNGIGRRTGMCDAGGAEAWSYDITAVGWKTTDARTIVGVTKTSSAQNNFDGSIASLTYPSGRVLNYTYSTAARPVSAIDPTGPINYATASSYSPPGDLTSLQNGANTVSTSYYNKRFQPCRISVKSSGTAPSSCTDAANIGNVLDFTYNFNLGTTDNGNVYGITNNRDTTRNQSFTYDVLNRISTAKTASTTGTKCWDELFGYDAWGNLMTIGRIAGYSCSNEELLNVTPTTKNQISGYTYDSAGNLINDGLGHAYVYNAENQLTSAGGASYIYDGDGKRVDKTGKLFWYGQNSDPLDETDLAGSTANSAFYEYAFFGGKRIARRDFSNAVIYYFADHLGTARIIANSSGTVLDDSDYYPFGGERVISSSSTNTYKFTGKKRDLESGLDNFEARFMSSSLGRFMSPDEPLLDQEVITPQSWNLYSYVRNNPLNNTDPTGNACVGGPGGTFHDDQSPGQTCAEVNKADSKVNPQAIVKAKVITPTWFQSAGMDSAYKKALTQQAEIYMRTGQWDKIEISNAAIPIGPGEVESLLQLAKSLGLSKNNIIHILKHLGEFQKLDPEMTIQEVVQIGEDVIKTGTPTSKGWIKAVSIGGKEVLVRAAVNADNILRTVFVVQ